jgi:predicted ribosome quality control (RQC) complex YloA/Tae2 family protein
MQILAGRNNTQNDWLTLKTAAKSDVWLHARKSHGAHVVLLCGGSAPDEASLSEAATIAAYYSSARADGKVPVDYTRVKQVKKPAGSRPGMVIYTDYKTIITVPDEKSVNLLKQ